MQARARLKAGATYTKTKPKESHAGRPFTHEIANLELYAFGFLQWRRHLQPSFRKGLDQGVFHRLGGGVSCGGEFTDEEKFGSLEHFLFAEGERLCAAKGNQTLQYGGYFDQRAGPHPFGVFLEPVLPVVMRIRFSFFQETKNLECFSIANYRPQANGNRVACGNHYLQPT